MEQLKEAILEQKRRKNISFNEDSGNATTGRRNREDSILSNFDLIE